MVAGVNINWMYYFGTCIINYALFVYGTFIYINTGKNVGLFVNNK